MPSLFQGFCLILFCCFSTAFSMPSHAATAGDSPRYAVSGELAAIEENSIAQIDDKRYRLAKDILVVDKNDRPLSIQQLKLPAYILFEYSYQQQDTKAMAPVIVFIKETKDTRRSGGAAQ